MSQNQQPQEQLNAKDFKRIFNMNYILNKIIAYGAYLILLGSIVILLYMSFIETLKLDVEWKTVGVFSIAVVGLAWFCWNTFYHKQFEKVLSDDIEQQSKKKYSVHSRYYMAIKDWKDATLQEAIDKFNDEYTAKWKRWVEKVTGKPIKTKTEKIIDPDTKEEKIVKTLGIEDLPYKGFKYKRIMWRIKNHKYPQSGYKTSMELMSLFSFQEANMNKRILKADRTYYTKKAIQKLVFLLLTITVGASIVPTITGGNIELILLKLILALGALFSAVFTGAISGIRGARLKLSIVEDACCDLEHWANKMPIIAPYLEPVPIITKTEETKVEPIKEPVEPEITSNIFKQLNMQISDTNL